MRFSRLPINRLTSHQRARPTTYRAILKPGDEESNAFPVEQVADELMPPALQRSLGNEEVCNMRNSVVTKVCGAAAILAIIVTEMRQRKPRSTGEIGGMQDVRLSRAERRHQVPILPRHRKRRRIYTVRHARHPRL